MPQSDAIYLDEIIEKAVLLCEKLPPRYFAQASVIKDCKDRLSKGSLQLAVMGMFKRGKSSFVNTLLGLDILPTSVIPVTSIPTTIKFGKELACTIRFFNKKPDLRVHGSVDAIKVLLQEYVAEENNPNNKLCVGEAIVECPNELLENGTLLIDTPGFGSTYVHNTKTTVDLLRTCDAVLFLLSSDPPFTQTEVEFLKEVHKTIPRIFFILNKIDLLTVDELNKIDHFIKGVLAGNLGFPAETKLFHVSVKMGRALKDLPENNPAWRISGVGAVRTEILDFMAREKYFTLSQAIIDKFKVALRELASGLDADYRECMEPVDRERREYEWLVHHGGSIRKKIDKERQLIDVEVKALHDFVDKTIDPVKADIQQKAKNSLHNILSTVSLKKSTLPRIARAAFEQHCVEMFNNLFLQVTGSVNKPFKKAVGLHAQEFLAIAREIQDSAPSVKTIVATEESAAQDMEISPDPQWGLEGVAAAFDHIKLPFCGFFVSRQTKEVRYETCFSLAITEIINRNILRLSLRIKEMVQAACREFKRDLDGRINTLLAAMNAAMEEKKISLENFETVSRPLVETIEEQKSEVSRIMGML
jgi:ribosome biogenesis GTPase A